MSANSEEPIDGAVTAGVMRLPGWVRTLLPRLIGFCVVAFIFYVMSLSKFATLQQCQVFDPKDDLGMYWTENAFHYRYAKMAALGDGIPAVDPKMQYPEGMHVLRDEMPMMERFAGFAWRHFHQPGIPFHVFLARLVCFYSSLIIFPAYLLSARLWRSALAGVVTCAFYALTYSFIGPVVLGAYVRQDFVLPFLFLATYFFVGAIDSGGGWRAVVAALVLLFSMASWHLSQFYYLVFLGCVTVVYFAAPGARAGIIRTLAVVTAMLFAASWFILPLRSGGLPLSFAMLASYALLIQHAVFRKQVVSSTWRRLIVFGVLLVALVALAGALPGGHYGRYSHVYALMIDKIRFLGVKPADPSRLSFESRVMWTSSFRSPGLSVWFGWLGMSWLAGTAGLLLAVREAWRARATRAGEWVVGGVAVLFALLFALIWRMEVFAAFFVCVMAGAVVVRLPSWRERVAALMIVLVLLASDFKKLKKYYLTSMAPLASEYRGVIDWLRQNTGPDDPVLALFQFSPVICAYADRPVIVHSKFENQLVREKVEEFYTRLYDPEPAFHAFCTRYGARYVVYQPAMLLDTSADSLRYMVNRLMVDMNSTAVLMNFAPQALQRFELVYQDPSHRIFRVLEAGETPHPAAVEPLPVYNSKMFRREDIGLR